MSLVRISCAVAVVLTLGCNSSSQSDSDGPKIDAWKRGKTLPERLMLLLSPRETQADIIIAKTSPEIALLNQKMQSALAQHPNAVKEIFDNEDDRGVVQWDARMGITKQEYAKILEATKHVTLAKHSATNLRIERAGTNSVKIIGLPRPSELHINTVQITASSPDGNLPNGVELPANAVHPWLGPISGVTWDYNSFQPSGTHALTKVMVAQGVESKELWLEIEVRGHDGQLTHEYFARCPGPSE